tara:strand:- start:315 stop:845 length:531 start_codon:yes stop_codon:yes gene_type:complete
MACSNINASNQAYDEAYDYHTLLSSLLSVNENKYTYLDTNDENKPDSLKLFKELERIYSRNIEPDQPNGQTSEKRLKVIMYFSFYAQIKNSGAFQEYLAEDLMPIFLNNMDSFSATMKELPFLIDSNCNRLNAYFGHEGKNKEKKRYFVTHNVQALTQHLNEDQRAVCMSNFELGF